MWDEITYPFPNFNSCTVEVWEWVSKFTPHFSEHMGLKSIHSGRRGVTCCTHNRKPHLDHTGYLRAANCEYWQRLATKMWQRRCTLLLVIDFIYIFIDIYIVDYNLYMPKYSAIQTWKSTTIYPQLIETVWPLLHTPRAGIKQRPCEITCNWFWWKPSLLIWFSHPCVPFSNMV